MDKSAVRAIVNKNIRWLRWVLAIVEWKISFEYGHCSGEVADGKMIFGYCESDVKYHTANIRLDPDAFDTEEAVLETLLHELLHVFHAHHQTLKDVYHELCSNDAEKAALDKLVLLIAETTVKSIEDMLLLGLGLSPKKMIAHAKRDSVAREEVVNELATEAPKRKPKRKKKARRKKSATR